MKLKEMESILKDCTVFDNPKTMPEKYPTTFLADRMLYTAHNTYDNIHDKSFDDFGCGCRILNITANISNVQYSVRFDINSKAIAITWKNCEEFDVQDYFLQKIFTSSIF